MESRHIMVILIVLIVMVAGVMRAKYIGGSRRHRDRDRELGHDDEERQRLRAEVKNLRERLAVIERITVEKENSLAREIEQLRDEPRR